MIDEFHEHMRCLEGVRLRPGAHASVLCQAETQNRIWLPREHKELLSRTNGIEVYAGYVRLFGIGAGAGIDAVRWNDLDYWKFAWQGRCNGFWCFGGTAWGDQYAYLIGGNGGGEVYFLDALSMAPERIAGSFEEFLEAEFARCAADPYDAMTLAARARFGAIESDLQLMYVPSPMLGGAEAIERVERVDARFAMIGNGDIAMQVDVAPDGAEISRIEPYVDKVGRTRLRLVWR